MIAGILPSCRSKHTTPLQCKRDNARYRPEETAERTQLRGTTLRLRSKFSAKWSTPTASLTRHWCQKLVETDLLIRKNLSTSFWSRITGQIPLRPLFVNQVQNMRRAFHRPFDGDFSPKLGRHVWPAFLVSFLKQSDLCVSWKTYDFFRSRAERP